MDTGLSKQINMTFKIFTFLVTIYFFETKEVFSQSLVGKYLFSERFFYKSLELFPNGTFIYYFSSEFIKDECKGNWQIRGRDLILDSSPKKDKIICHEFRRGRKAYTYFNVKSKNYEGLMFYYLYIIKNSGDTIELKDQFNISKIRVKGIKGFFIINTSGIKSPTYLVQERGMNWFYVLLEDDRVFENEDWRISEMGLLPRNNSGDYEDFLLKKKPRFNWAKPEKYDMHSNPLINAYPPFKDYNLNNYLRNYSVNPSIFSKIE